MRIYLGSDHNGYHLKEKVFAYLAKRNYDAEDIGGFELDPKDDFPQFAQMAAIKVIGDDDSDPRAILLCGSGQGMAMAANRFRGIRASVVHDADEAKVARNDFDSNIPCLPSKILDKQRRRRVARHIRYLPETKFADAPRFRRRNTEMDII